MNSTNNLLRLETSPYLLQHADNPVHWLPWNAKSLALAKQSNKPILLSIGYSACHWCHVMAHESFEDPHTADIMNALYICIKVDKEERPDLDKIYQNAHSLLTERPGGWPLTLFLTPSEHMPIFAGTYFPVTAKHGLPAFTDLLQQISEIWLSRKDDIQQQSNALQSSYQRLYQSSKPEPSDFNHAVIDIARSQVTKQFDSKHGGFSGTPKFPHPSIIDFALKHWAHTKRTNHTQGSGSGSPQPDNAILHSALFSLQKMADGGIFDHLGGGFCRYSTDELWMIPHFEKMLYDNGPLLSLYSEAWKITAEPLFFDTASETANWVMQEMQAPGGGYYASQDADSEGHEGKFFVWSQAEIATLLKQCTKNPQISESSVSLFRKRFGLDKAENFEGLWHLHGYHPVNTLANNPQDEQHLYQQFKLIRQQLFKHRAQRVHPETDTKVLTAWNGLMIHGMSNAGRQLNNEDYIQSAIQAALFIKQHCWQNGQLFANYKDGTSTLNAYIDDYAFMMHGLLALLQSQWHDELYEWTLALADKLLSDFEDTDYGGFYFTSHHHETLIQRLKIFSDDAIPSGNAIAALTLNRLGYLSGRKKYIDAAKNCLTSGWTAMNHSPVSHCALLTALGEHLTPANILIIRSQRDDGAQWEALTKQYYLPFTLVFNIPAELSLHLTLAAKTSANTTIAYPCQGMTCHNSIHNAAELEKYLQQNSPE